MVFSRRIATRVQPYIGYRNATRLALSARALRSAHAEFTEGSRIDALRAMLSHFASREIAGVNVRIVLERDGQTVLDCQQATDSEGFVHFDIPFDTEHALPATPRWEKASLHWDNAEGPQSAEAPILAPGAASALGIISDIDDTIVESGITGGLRNIARNWKRVVAQMPSERIPVPGASDFYSTFAGDSTTASNGLPSASQRPVFYISSSPWNLFSYLVALKKLHRLPLGPLLLRDWGLNRDTFGSGSHGAHKTSAINAILRTYPAMRFAAIGDDTQGDLRAFADAAGSHPDRIAAVFLRKASDKPLSSDELSAKAEIEAAGIPLWMGESFKTAGRFLASLGLAEAEEPDRIGRAMDAVRRNSGTAGNQSSFHVQRTSR